MQLFHQPYKCVAAADIPKNALTLIPASLRIECPSSTHDKAKHDKAKPFKPSPGYVSLGNMSIIGEEVAFYIAPHIIPPLEKQQEEYQPMGYTILVRGYDGHGKGGQHGVVLAGAAHG